MIIMVVFMMVDFYPPFSKEGRGDLQRVSENPPKSPFFKGGLNIVKSGASD
jgi:hypothetical protein